MMNDCGIVELRNCGIISSTPTTKAATSVACGGATEVAPSPETKRASRSALRGLLIVVALAVVIAAVPATAQTAPNAPSASKDFRPLTPAQKFGIFSRTTYDPFVWLTAGIGSGIDQASNSPSDWGQGGEAYGKRFGANLAGQASNAFLGRWLLPTILHQDPRYFRRGGGGFGRRLGHVISSVLVTRTDSGGRAFNASLVGGALMSGALANAYYPDGERGAGLTLSSAGFGLAGAAASNFTDEFFPGIKHKVLRK